MEVYVHRRQEELVALLESASWRRRAIRAISAPTKPTLRALARLRREAENSSWMAVLSEPVQLEVIRLREEGGKDWASKAWRVCQDGGVAPVSQVEAIVLEAEGLHITPDKDLMEVKLAKQLKFVS